MMLDPIAAYRAAQVNTGTPAGRIVLLYEGAIRFAAAHLDALDRRDLATASRSSIRAQDIVNALNEALDPAAGTITENLRSLYGFIASRLVDGNVAKDPTPTREALTLLRDLLPAWKAIAGQTFDAAGSPMSHAAAHPAPLGQPVQAARPRPVDMRTAALLAR